MTDHCFISYSTADALDFARRLADELQGGEDIFIKTWFDKRDIDPARDWDDQIVDGIRSCICMLFVMTKDSTAPGSMCKNEWNWALRYKKPVVPIRLHADVEQPFGLGNRQWIDFTGEFEHGLSRLRLFLRDMDSPKGVLQSLKDRHADAERDLRRAKPEDQPRIQAEIDELNKQIEAQQKIVDNPKAAEEQTEKNIQAGLERERQPDKPVAKKTSTKFINPPPGIAPTYFQDRLIETQQVVNFLHDDAQRLMTIVGRGGVGKTAMVCRLLKALESGQLPDNLGEMKIDGIVYLSESGSHRVNFPNIFADLNKLLPSETSDKLDTLYKDPKASVESKMNALLEHFQGERVMLLLDNFEPVVNPETQEITDKELVEALCALVSGPHHMVNALITTRVAPRKLNLCEPGRQRVLTLDEGLESPYAENILREMDEYGKLGLKVREESDSLLQRAREKTRGYPRALEALFAILSSDRYTTLEELLELPLLPENVVEALVGEAFSRLDATAQKVMEALAVYNRPVTPAAVDYLLQPHLPEIDSAPVLNRLVNMHFVRREAGRYYLHPVDHDYAFSKVPADSPLLQGDEAGVRSEFTQHDLLTRAADYFVQARKPRAEWKKLDDLAAQLAEFDLRCAAGDYDTPADVLTDIDFDYLLLWGHFQLTINLHSRVKDKITDINIRMSNLNGLGVAHSYIGNVRECIYFFQQGLETANEAKDHYWENTFLGNLGNAYGDLGDARKAIEYYEDALIIARDIGDIRNEGSWLGNLGNINADLGNERKAIEYFEDVLLIARNIKDESIESGTLVNIGHVFLDLEDFQKSKENIEQAIQIADKISFQPLQQYSRWELGQVYLFQNNLSSAKTTTEAAFQYHGAPQHNLKVTALYGLITLRQGDTSAARQAFTRAITQADEILTKTPGYYDALDAKGLALCGLVLTTGDSHLGDDCHLQAIETFRAARKIAPHAGIVKRNLRLFDELAKCDPEGLLVGVREAVQGDIK